jgi:hypothetical protein
MNWVPHTSVLRVGFLTALDHPAPPPRIAIQLPNSTVPWISLRLSSPACYHSACYLDPPSPFAQTFRRQFPHGLQRTLVSLLFSILLSSIVSVVAQREPSYPLSFHSVVDSFRSNGRVHPPPSILFPVLLPRLRSAGAKIARFCATSPLLATLAHFMGGGGSMKPIYFRVHPLLQRLALDQQLRDQLCAAH